MSNNAQAVCQVLTFKATSVPFISHHQNHNCGHKAFILFQTFTYCLLSLPGRYIAHFAREEKEAGRGPWSTQETKLSPERVLVLTYTLRGVGLSLVKGMPEVCPSNSGQDPIHLLLGSPGDGAEEFQSLLLPSKSRNFLPGCS